MRSNLYSVRTTNGLVFYVEARTRHEAEQRARSPAVTREIVRALLDELGQIEAVELHRGPTHTAHRKLVLDDTFFKP